MHADTALDSPRPAHTSVMQDSSSLDTSSQRSCVHEEVQSDSSCDVIGEYIASNSVTKRRHADMEPEPDADEAAISKAARLEGPAASGSLRQPAAAPAPRQGERNPGSAATLPVEVSDSESNSSTSDGGSETAAASDDDESSDDDSDTGGDSEGARARYAAAAVDAPPAVKYRHLKGVAIVEDLADSAAMSNVKSLLKVQRYYDDDIGANGGGAATVVRFRCFNCGLPGHLARECTNPPKLMPCQRCAGVDGHSMHDCPNSLCFKCGKTGHIVSECPNPDPPKESFVCIRCGRKDCGASGFRDWKRSIGACTSGEYRAADLAHTKCMTCGKYGHASCLQAPLEPLQPTCCLCGRAGHTGLLDDCQSELPSILKAERMGDVKRARADEHRRLMNSYDRAPGRPGLGPYAHYDRSADYGRPSAAQQRLQYMQERVSRDAPMGRDASQQYGRGGRGGYMGGYRGYQQQVPPSTGGYGRGHGHQGQHSHRAAYDGPPRHPPNGPPRQHQPYFTQAPTQQQHPYNSGRIDPYANQKSTHRRWR